MNAEVVALESQVTVQRTILASMRRSRVITLAGLSSTPQARGKIFWDETAQVWHLEVENLPRAPVNRDYQLWAVPAAGSPVSAVVFNTDASGAAMIELPAPMVAGLVKLAAVTEEPSGGSPQPTTTAFNLLGTVQ